MADSDNQVAVNVTAKTGELAAGMRQGADAVRQGVTDIRGQLGQLDAQFGKIMGVFGAFSAALAGGAALKQFVSAALDATKEAAGLGKALGMTATEASYLADAASRVGVSSDTLTTMGRRIEMQLLKNEDAFKKLGVATRDANGNFRSTGDIMQDTNAKLREFQVGVNQNIEGMKIYGKQWGEVSAAVQKFGGVTEDTRAKSRAMGAVIGQEDLDNMAKYRKAMMELKEIKEAVAITIGRAVLPRFAEMGKFLGEIGPTVISVMRAALAGYLTIQDSVTSSVRLLGETIFDIGKQVGAIIHSVFGAGGSATTPLEFFANMVKVVQVAFIGFRVGVQTAITVIGTGISQLVEMFRGLAEVAVKALKLDFSGAKKAAADSFDEIVRLGKAGMDKLVDVTTKGRDDITAALDKNILVANITEVKAKPATGLTSEGGEKKEKENLLALWEAELLEAKKKYMLENDMREMSLQDERAFWQRKSLLTEKGSKDYNSVQKKAAEADFADMKRMAAQRHALEQEAISFTETLNNQALDSEQAAFDRRKDLGLVSDQEALQAEADFARKRTEIQLKALQDRLDIAYQDPTNNIVAIQQLEDQKIAIITKSEEEQAAIRHKGVMQSRADLMGTISSIQSGFQSNLASLMNGMQTFVGFIRNMLTTVLTAFANMGAKIVSDWLFNMLRAKFSQSITALAQVQSNAAVAASAAFASTAAIPIVGPALAPEAAAAAYASTMAWAPSASARNGFDIPAGVNPVTQLHEREMVLPARQADVIRNMADGGGAAGAAPVIHIHALDAKSVTQLFKDNGKALVESLRMQTRNFAV